MKGYRSTAIGCAVASSERTADDGGAKRLDRP
jgi:hypothetical protein